MTAWHTVLQDASFRGVRFDVLSLEESDGKALAEHAYPFRNGTVLEDMGTTGRQVRIAAVFWGKQYHSRLNTLLEALAERGGGTLVHPVWGRLNHMVAADWHFRHEADYVDYAVLDMTFRESGTPQKILVFENRFLMELERLTAKIDAYRAALNAFGGSLTAVGQETGALFGSVSGLWGAAHGIWGALRGLTALPFPRFGGGAFAAAAFARDMAAWTDDAARMAQTAVFAAAGIDGGRPADSDTRNAKTRFDEALRQGAALAEIPRQAAAAPSRAAHRRTDVRQTALLAQLLRLSALAALFQVACLLIERYGGEMNAPELMHCNRAVRLRVRAETDALRALLRQLRGADGFYAAYETGEVLTENLRRVSGSLNALVLAAVNQKPPLIVRPAPLDGTMQQMAFAFYGDIGRTAELMRLNPHIVHPAFVRRGEFINGYAE